MHCLSPNAKDKGTRSKCNAILHLMLSLRWAIRYERKRYLNNRSFSRLVPGSFTQREPLVPAWQPDKPDLTNPTNPGRHRREDLESKIGQAGSEKEAAL
jgi:hypothetical protein